MPVGVAAGEIEEIDACEDDKEAGEEGEGVDCVCRIEAAEQDEGGDEGGGCEGHVVERVYSVELVSVPSRNFGKGSYIEVENWLRALLK